MKNLTLSLVSVGMVLGLIVFSFGCHSKGGEKELTFKVYGNCEMCKKTIESSLEKDKGIASASWNVDTKMMKVLYDPAATNEKEIYHLIAESGYDTEQEKAAEKTYKSLPACCQYERKK